MPLIQHHFQHHFPHFDPIEIMVMAGGVLFIVALTFVI
jgi:hypothetical protein